MQSLPAYVLLLHLKTSIEGKPLALKTGSYSKFSIVSNRIQNVHILSGERDSSGRRDTLHVTGDLHQDLRQELDWLDPGDITTREIRIITTRGRNHHDRKES
jgi:hypothetical protein